jgi:hypothetical protein
LEIQHGGIRRVAGDGQLDGADSAEGHVGRGYVGRVRAERERLERLPVLGCALAQVERFGAQGRINGVPLVLAHVSSSEGSGGQDGLAWQLSGGSLVVDGGQVGQRPPLGDVDLQVAGVDAGDELAELGGVAAGEDPHRPHPAPGIVGAGGGRAGEGAAV